MTYDNFKDKPISHKITLAELSLKKECTGWSSGGGVAYKCTFNDAIDNAPIDIDGVEVDGTALTEAASITEVQNNPDRWFQDAANNLLYVSLAGSANPDTKTVIAIFKIYLATEGIIFNANFYHPRIPEDGINLDCSSDYMDSGKISILNGDGLFDTKLGDWIWRGCSCMIKMGGDDLTYAQYEPMGDFLITSIDYSSDEITLNLKGIKLNWNRELPLNEFYTAQEILKPNANGTYTGWAAEGGAAWQCVDDEVGSKYGDKWGTYIKLSSGSAKASFKFPASAIPAGATINFVTLYVVGGVALNDNHEIKLFIKSGATESAKSFGHYWAHSNSWCEKIHSWAVNPADGEAWEKADIDALEVGVDGDTKGISGQELYVTRVYRAVNYSVMKTTDEGKCLPILYGAISTNEDATFTPVLIDNTVEKGIFGLADKSVQRIHSVSAVKYEGDTLTPTTHYTVDKVNCTILIKTAYPKTIDDPSALKVYLKGAQINDIPGESSTEHIASASHILRHLFTRVLEWDIAKIDDASFDAAATDAPQACRLFITDKTYVADIIALICQSVRGVLSQDRDGKIYFNIWSEDDTGAIELEDEDILECNINERNITPAYRVVVKYGRDVDSGDWLMEKAEDLSVKYKYKQVETKTFETLLVKKSDAHDLAYELLDAYNKPIKEPEILTKLQASKLKVGDKIKITRSRAPGSDGNWSAKTFQVKTITKEGGYRARLVLEPNKYLSASTVSTDEKMEYDDKEAISRAIACLTTNAYCFKSDRKIEGRDETIGTTVIKIKSDGDFKGNIYDSAGSIILLHSADKKLHANMVDGASRNIKDKIDKVEGAIEDTTYLVKMNKVIATSIQLDEALRKDTISIVAVGKDAAVAIAHGQDYPVNFEVSMFSSDGGVAYNLHSFNNLAAFLDGWYTLITSTGLFPHLESNGNMETGSPPTGWIAENGAILASVADPVHGGLKALKITIAAAQTWGGAYQEIDVLPGPASLNPASCFDARVWGKNGNATRTELHLRDVTNGNTIGYDESTSTDWIELKALRKPAGSAIKKISVHFRVTGVATQYVFFDDAKACWPEKSIGITQIGGPAGGKDFTARAWIEQAGT